MKDPWEQDLRGSWLEFMRILAAHAGRAHDAEFWQSRPNIAHIWARDTARAANAGHRLMIGRYLPWQEAGGPDECSHGYAMGIPCRDCDIATVTIWHEMQHSRPSTETHVEAEGET